MNTQRVDAERADEILEGEEVVARMCRGSGDGVWRWVVAGLLGWVVVIVFGAGEERCRD